MPTPKRSLPSIAIRRKAELILFDCGEGTQARMFEAKVGFNRKTTIFITHSHGDHILGLPGIIQTMSLLGRERRVDIHGPSGTEKFVRAILDTVAFKLTFPIYTHEVREAGVIVDGKEYTVEGVWADHGDIPTLAYALIEKDRPGKFIVERARKLGIPRGSLWRDLQNGKTIMLGDKAIRPRQVLGPPQPGRKIVYSGDTRPCKSVQSLARGADVLIHDATLDAELSEKAWESGHSTASQAAKVAKLARVKRLVLFHISPRYKDPQRLLLEAKEVFPNTSLVDDLQKIEVPFS